MVNTRGLTSDPWSAEEHHDHLPLIGHYLTLLASDWPAMSWGPGPVWWSASVIPSPGPRHDTSTRPSHHIPPNNKWILWSSGDRVIVFHFSECRHSLDKIWCNIGECCTHSHGNWPTGLRGFEIGTLIYWFFETEEHKLLKHMHAQICRIALNAVKL